ncbi:MAG: EamA family transporter [Bdellovibrionales bacterium]
MPYLLSVGANLFFSIASIYFAIFSKRTSVLWMNLTKTGVALISAGLVLLISRPDWWPGINHASPFLLSGMMGLGLGDFFMLLAFFRIGASRTLMLWGFQPIVVGIGCYFIFGDVLGLWKLVAILFMMCCLFTFSYEGFKEKGHWEFLGLLYALIGMSLDASSVVLTKWAFGQAPLIVPLQAQLLRCSGALFILVVLYFLKSGRYWAMWKEMPAQDRGLIFAASFLGTFLSLFLSLTAIQTGHLPSIAAIGVTCPLFTGIFEHFYEKKWPNATFLAATLFFIVGFAMLMSDHY